MKISYIRLHRQTLEVTSVRMDLMDCQKSTDALNKLSTSVIHWPDANSVNVIKNEFARKEFPNTIGCIDGSYIPIPEVEDHGIVYKCRKNFSYLTLKGICDNRMLFTHCYAGEVGFIHDATVLKRGEVWDYLSIDEMFPENTHVPGNKACPLLPTPITPYKHNGYLNNKLKRFIYIHSKCQL
ncbi:hypothetical protein NQ314_002381 [Rhamnusium bicolor]|uniref:DDE Tnp4 domain-containing protein n=1 Tax=Rhamnusium bicolor TaxID=1586634 RepID=A0AAV8ZPQ9_9CUCU|nr:hypothetical protein NQ314_002381 [Rhamnusium bicolor]